MHRISIFVLVALTVFQTAAIGQSSADKLQLPGLRSEVTVRKDARGVSYIDASNDDDLYFAQGYITASDRLWQMDLMRRLARGETAEIFGERTLDEDKRWRRFGFSQIADDSLQYLSPTLRNALDSYAKGVNAYIATLDDKTLPVEFRILQYKPREWRAADTVVIGKILADALSTTWRNDLMRLQMQQLPADKLADLTNVVNPYDVVLFGKDEPKSVRSTVSGTAQAVEGTPQATEGTPSGVAATALIAAADRDDQLRASSLARVGLYAEELAASNNWVISGKLTADGKALLANDPHLAPTAPGIWYLVSIKSPTVNAAGVTFPGVPGVVLGHNE
ncbi:MAG: penicillin acylase family protein, partial [Blastocatellia bacterium]|nr:penicillin acylase family protein [Blastocatellia bacterium]